MRFDDRYSSAIHSSNLKSKPDTHSSDSDVLGAAGLAGKRKPLAMALLRLFSGDNRASGEIVGILARMASSRAWETDQVSIPNTEAEDLGRKVLAWHRDGVCKACHGHGYALIEGAPSLSGNACAACKGTGKMPFDPQFSMERLPLARWLRERVEREQAFAGAEAMAALAPRLDF
jgi:hypothetical protein